MTDATQSFMLAVSMPLVSVVMPMHNAAPYVRAAVESVLAQDGVELELVVIDDRSQDGSGELVRSISDRRVRVLACEGPGISAAMNQAVAASRGDVISRCDADDLYPPDRLAWQMQWLDAHPDFGAVCGQFATISPEGRHIRDLGGSKPLEITAELQEGNLRTSLCTYGIRASLMRALPFRPYFISAEDVDFTLRLSQVARVWYEPRRFYLYRLHGRSITHSMGGPRNRFFHDTAIAFAVQRYGGEPDDLEKGCPPRPPPVELDRRHAQRHIHDQLLGAAWREHRSGNRRAAFRTGLRAVQAMPMKVGTWRSVMMLALKRPQMTPVNQGRGRTGWLQRRPFRWIGRDVVRPLCRRAIGLLHRWRMNEWTGDELRQSAIIFAPHPDDETLGCGCTILRKTEAGAQVAIVVMTDGSASHPDKIAPEELKARRHQEMLAAAHTLHVRPEHVTFFDFPDGNLRQWQQQALARVIEVLEQERPQQVFIPYRLDGSPDHAATTEVVRQAIAAVCPERTTIYEYPIWFWCYWPWISAGSTVREVAGNLRRAWKANRHLLRDFRSFVPAGESLPTKRTAYNRHASQTTRLDGDPTWFTLRDVSDGEFVACFFRDREIFHRYQVNKQVADAGPQE